MTRSWGDLLAVALIGIAAACSRAQTDKAADSAAAATPDSSPSTAAPMPGVAATAAPATSSPPDTSTTAKGAPAPVRGDSSTATPTPRPTPSETVLTGKVVAGGLAGAPTTSLQIEGGKPTTLLGPLETELRRLGGATVWVTGAPGLGQPNATFTVSRYEIVSIDGVKPLVGRVVGRDGTTLLEMERDTVKLLAVPAELVAKSGAKVWVIGRRAGKEVTTQTYGIIREP